MPITPFIGVRISWLIVARNSLLARSAAWAATASSFGTGGRLFERQVRLGHRGVQRRVADRDRRLGDEALQQVAVLGAQVEGPLAASARRPAACPRA